MLLFIFSTLIIQSQTKWLTLINGQLNFPEHIYLIECTEGQTLTLFSRWQRNAKIDLYLFKKGQNLNQFSEFVSNTSNVSTKFNQNKTLLYNISSSGKYYVRAVLVNLNESGLNYSLSILLRENNETSFYTNSTFYKQFSDIPTIVFSIPYTKLRIKYTPPTNFSETQLIFQEPNTTLCKTFFSNDSDNAFQVSLSNFDDFGYATFSIVFISPNAQVKTQHQTLNYHIFYDDQNMNDSYKIVNGTEIFNKSINSTVESSFSEDTWSFVPLIMAIFDLVGIICVLYFKYKYRKKIIKKEICPICLQNFYNIHITLNCKHRFHLSCLKMWQLVKPICPTCKRSIKR